MKKVRIAVIALASGLLASGAHARTIYHVDNGHAGTAVFSAGGACKSKVVYENAVYGIVYDSSNAYIGSGIVSAGGGLLAIVDEDLTISGFADATGMKLLDTHYVDFSSTITANTFAFNGICDIRSSVADTRSRLVHATDRNKGFDKVTLKYGFTAYLPLVAVTRHGDTFSNAKAFKGSITFKGSRPVI